MSDVGVISTMLITVAGCSAILTTDFERRVPGAVESTVAVASAPIETKPGTLRPELGMDGRLYVDALVNGTQVRFLLDTAASHTVISRDDAARLGVTVGAETRLSTVGGVIVAHRGMARTLSIGGSRLHAGTFLIVPDLPHPLLGMDTIRALDSKRIEFADSRSTAADRS